MPENCTLTCFIDSFTLVVLAAIIGFLLYKKAWTQKPMWFILINAVYSLASNLFNLVYPITSHTSDVVSNLTMHVDTLSGLGFFYYLWNLNWYRKYLIYSVIPVILVWLGTFLVMRDLSFHSWTLLLPSIWYLFASNLALYLLYKKANFQQTQQYGSRFLLITGFLFYNFTYIVVELFYLRFKDDPTITIDAWNINYWGYFIFRLMNLAGVLLWFAKPSLNPNPLIRRQKVSSSRADLSSP